MPRVAAWRWRPLLAAALALSPSALAQVVASIDVPVQDLPTSVRFYTQVLGFRVVDRNEQAGAAAERDTGLFGAHTESAVLQLGQERLVLTEFLCPRGRPMPADGRSNDRWFQHVCIVVRDIDKAYAVLRQRRVRHSSPLPQTLPESIPAAAGIKAFYFQDPDGHPLEILQFPADKGDPRWRTPGDELFLGIDHTAIVVADTERSLAFWRDQVGLRVAGTSDNRGDEQAHLNNVEGAHLRITTLRGTGGPGVELLQYVAPTDGRPMAADTRANDLWHWSVAIEGVVAPATGREPFAADPDGHRVRCLPAVPR